MGRPFADLSVEEQSALRLKRIERLELVIARLMGGEATPEDMGIAHGLRAAYEKEQHPLLEGEVIDGRLHAPRPDGTCSGCYSRGLANVYSLLGTATLTDDGREAARALNPLPCPSCQGLGCTCPGYCEMGGNTLPDHTCPTCEGTGQIERPVRRAT